MKKLNLRVLASGLMMVFILMPGVTAAKTGVLLVAPDRGFAGNEEVRNAINATDAEFKQVLFVTDDRSRVYLDEAVARFRKQRVTDLAVLPMFLTLLEPRWKIARQWLKEDACIEHFSCRFSAPFGQSYLAIDTLNEAISQVASRGLEKLLIIGNSSAGDANALRSAWMEMATSVRAANRFASVEVFIWRTADDMTGQARKLKSLAAEPDTGVVSWHLGPKLDSMMSFDGMLRHRLLHGLGPRYQNAVISSDDLMLWMQREFNRHMLRSARDIGVVVLAHGAHFHWNQTMRSAIAPLEKNYTVAAAFSMADRASIAAALSTLEERGKRGAVIVRVFGIEDSFRRNIETMIGMDIERNAAGPSTYLSDGGGMPGMANPAPIRSKLVVTSVGGLDDHPLFAAGLLARADEVSTDPPNETIIVVGHGRGDDVVNDRWQENLASLVAQMKANGGDKYRAIYSGTWREDWPEKRGAAVARIRALIEEARTNGSRVILVPARTASGGPAQQLIPDLEFVEAKGFAPHPLFTEWLKLGIGQLLSLATRQSTQ